MRTLDLGRYAVSAGTAVALLTACALRPAPNELPAAVAPAGPLADTASASHPMHGSSWMAGGNAKQDLLYVSNGDGIVNVYRYSQHNLVGELTKFTQPEGECTDASGNVYITDYATSTIAEYAHGGKTALRVIDGSPYGPYGCAVNLKNGDLAVANYNQASSYSEGNVAVYAHAKGTPTYYSNKDLYQVNACAYDKYGDLLVTGFSLYSGYRLYTSFAYLPAKSENYQEIALPPPNSTFGWYDFQVHGMGWDGEYWTVEAYDELYQYTINIKPQLIGSVELQGDSSPVAFYFANPKKQATQAVGADNSQSAPHAYYWNYPAGGPPYVTITHGLDRPFGVAISAGK